MSQAQPANHDITVTLPDGSTRTYPAGTTGEQVAASIGAGLAKAAVAMEKMLRAGINLEDISRVARVGVYETMFGLIQAIDEGGDPDAGDDLPGWALIEISPEGEATGRIVDALHESILELLPTEDEEKYL